MVTRRVEVRPRSALAVATWAGLLVAAFGVAGRVGLGTLLTGAFILQVTPSIWTAYRTERPTGISRGTWLLILGELSCWLTFGLHQSDPRLIVLGCSGVAAAILMLGRIETTSRRSAAEDPGTSPLGYVPPPPICSASPMRMPSGPRT
jgi:hypothetical protein